jgi:hypothetical protein
MNEERGQLRFGSNKSSIPFADTRSTWKLKNDLHAARLLPLFGQRCLMFGIPRRYSHFVFAVIQSGLTCLIAAGIASFPSPTTGNFFWHWLVSWLIAWVTMLPIVLLAAPAIRSLALALTREEQTR